MEKEFDSQLDYTYMAWEHLYKAVDNPYFQDMDADLIFKTLAHEMRLVFFGDYLKRYLYRTRNINMPFNEVPLSQFQDIIINSFRENGTPASFEPTSAKISSLAKNWLTQRTVKRKVVFLLGFGLHMNLEDVNTFLANALSEKGINIHDPFEIICKYCFENGYGFDRFLTLQKKYLTGNPETAENGTCVLKKYDDSTEAALAQELARLKTGDRDWGFQPTARMTFLSLYDRARELVADIYNQSEEEQARVKIAEYQCRLNNNTHLSEEEKRKRIQTVMQKVKRVTSADITEADLEQVICAAIPRDKHGNLTKGAASQLNEQFSGKRFSRQHIRDILAEKTEVNRFDLITLQFFIFSQELETYPNRKKRYSIFIEETNHMLKSCNMGDLYVTNPYECFILMCILSDDPLGTYADVWEISYNK